MVRRLGLLLRAGVRVCPRALNLLSGARTTAGPAAPLFLPRSPGANRPSLAAELEYDASQVAEVVLVVRLR